MIMMVSTMISMHVDNMTGLYICLFALTSTLLARHYTEQHGCSTLEENYSL